MEFSQIDTMIELKPTQFTYNCLNYLIDFFFKWIIHIATYDPDKSEIILR